jgi:hypothetical protein
MRTPGSARARFSRCCCKNPAGPRIFFLAHEEPQDASFKGDFPRKCGCATRHDRPGRRAATNAVGTTFIIETRRSDSPAVRMESTPNTSLAAPSFGTRNDQCAVPATAACFDCDSNSFVREENFSLTTIVARGVLAIQHEHLFDRALGKRSANVFFSSASSRAVAKLVTS